MVGTKPVSARFELLPNTQPRMSALGTSPHRSNCGVGVPGHCSIAISPTDDSKSYVHGDEPRRAATRNSRSASAETTSSCEVKVQPPRPPVEVPRPKMDVAKYFAPPKIVPPKPKVRQVEPNFQR